MLGKIAELFDGIPRLAMVAVVLLAIIGGVWFWKRRSAGRAVVAADRETEMIKADRAAAQYAQMVAKNLPQRRDEDFEESEGGAKGDADEEITAVNGKAVTDRYVQTVGSDQEVSADDDDEEYEPMDA